MGRTRGGWWLVFGSVLLLPAPGAAGDVHFRRHTIDPKAQFVAVAAFDVNHDGHIDIVCGDAWYEGPAFTKKHPVRDVEVINGRPDGFAWAEAPEDRRTGRWVGHPDFDLDAASIPILVVDVNGDGLNDIVYSRAHHYGVYWLEQVRTKDKGIQWVKHVIDTSWAGGHTPVWADLDGDGTPELILGKRFMAHEGADPGEHDPLVIY